MDNQDKGQLGIVTTFIDTKGRYYLTLLNGEEIILLSEDLQGESFILGDILQFETKFSKRWRLCAFRVVKVSNIYYENLVHNFERGIPVEGYVYAHNAGGYKVNCGGYTAFLPHIYSCYKQLVPQEADLLKKKHLFNVFAIQEDKVILTRIPQLEKEHQELVRLEVENMVEEIPFTGTIKSVQGYGLFVSNQYSVGLLHLKEMAPWGSRFTKLSKTDKNSVEEALKQIFLPGTKIKVWIIAKESGKYNLDWNPEDPLNRQLAAQLEAELPGLYSDPEIDAPLGVPFTGTVDSIQDYGILVSKAFKTRLLHWTAIFPNAFSKADLLYEDKQKIAAALQLVFREEEPVTVWVQETDGDKAILGWNPNASENSDILERLKLHFGAGF